MTKQKFFFENNSQVINLEDNLNHKLSNDIRLYLENLFTKQNLSLSGRYIIEGNMGDYIIYDNKNIELFGECS